jgi:hypothetical protein
MILANGRWVGATIARLRQQRRHQRDRARDVVRLKRGLPARDQPARRRDPLTSARIVHWLGNIGVKNDW